jgi:hypothetical protein
MSSRKTENHSGLTIAKSIQKAATEDRDQPDLIENLDPKRPTAEVFAEVLSRRVKANGRSLGQRSPSRFFENDIRSAISGSTRLSGEKDAT